MAAPDQIGKKWRRMALMYRRFARDYPHADYSEAAMLAMYRHESFGEPMPQADRLNGYELGKKWMDVTVAAWKEDLPQLGLLVSELQADGYPDWFLRKVGVLSLAPTPAGCMWWASAELASRHVA